MHEQEGDILDLETRTEGGWTIVNVNGEVDLHTAPMLRERIHELTEQGTDRIVLDLGGLSFMDSTGLGVLVAGLKRLKTRDGEFVLAGAQDPVRKILEVTGLHRVFDMRDSVAEVTGGG